MKRVFTSLALAVAVVGCADSGLAPVESVAETKGIRLSIPAPIEYSHDTIRLTPEGGPRAPGMAASMAPAMVEGGDGEHYNLVRVARIPAPVVGGQTVQANDILISGSTAYIAYNYQGTPWVGAVQAVNIAQKNVPVPMYQIDFGSMDINALHLDRGELLVTGAADPSVWDDMIAFASHVSAGSPDPDAFVDNVVALPSYAGTGIRRDGNNTYVGVGALNGSIQVLDGDFNPTDEALDYADVRDLELSGSGLLAITGTTDNPAPTGRVIILGGTPTEVPLVDFGSDYHKATVEVWDGTLALLGLSEAGFKVLNVSTGAFIFELPNPESPVPGLLTNTNSASTDGNLIVTANGEYGFRVLRPNGGQFDDVEVIGYFSQEYPPNGTLQEKFSVNHVEMEDGCFFAAAGAWGVYVYCFEAAPPEISVTKTPNPAIIGWTSGGLGNFVADRTFLEDGGGLPDGEFFFGAPTCDDAGLDDEPNQVDFNCMGRADNVSGVLGLQWTWDATGVWMGGGQTGDGCALLDTDDDGDANFSACVRIDNDPNTGAIRQIGGDGTVFLYSCGDGRPDRCTQQHALLANVGSTTCSIALVPTRLPGSGNANSQDDPTNDVQATCAIDLSLPAFQGVDMVDLLNVCAYPSGPPNSAPFDCVVTPGSGFIRITKLVDPAIVDLFGFTLSPASTDGSSKYAVQSGVTTALIPVRPGSFSVTETLPGGWFLDEVSCVLDDASTGQLAGLTVSGIEVKTGQTTLCTFSNVASTSKAVSYTIVVTNHGLWNVTLTGLVDDIFGSLNGVGTCNVGGTISHGDGTYTCVFTETLTGAPGDEHTNIVTATAANNDGTGSASGSATVTFVEEQQAP